MVEQQVTSPRSQQKEQFKNKGLLGTGTYGKAHLVQSTLDQQMYVIKAIDMSNMDMEERLRTKNEAKILQVLSHPNIVCFKDVFKRKSKGQTVTLSIVMEYCDGTDLEKEIKQQKRRGELFDEAQILDYFTQICLAIKHSHDRKIMHRDIKPQNVFLTRRGICKIGDFGCSKLLGGTLSRARSVVGTPSYLSPEIIQSKQYNMKTDIWSLGVLLYEMAALCTPWQSTNLTDLGVEIVEARYPPLPSHFSMALKNIVQLCMQKRPSQRPNINAILNMPVIKDRVKYYLEMDVFKEEFSHTILHGQNVFQEHKRKQEI